MSTYTKKEYNSNNGMQTSVFGPIWFTLHLISFNYPVNPTPKDKENYMNYIRSYKYVLPCIYCRTNFDTNLKEVKFGMSSMKNRESFSRFVYNLHNAVNKMLGKHNTISYREVRDRYESFRSRCSDNKTKKEISEIKKKQIKNKKEEKCHSSLYNTKGKAIIEIIPKKSKKKSFLNSCKNN